jgi:hypothetical protein
MASRDAVATSTIPSAEIGPNGWETGLRAVSVALVGALVLLGLLGLLGVRTAVATASDNGFSISVNHAAITRAGLATPFDIEVGTEDGSPLPASITIRVDSSYLAMFDENGLEPEPSSSFNSPDWTWWTFDIPPETSVLEFSFDARLEPAVQWGRGATAAIEIDGREMVAVEFETWVMP